jgi:hypothetical protein
MDAKTQGVGTAYGTQKRAKQSVAPFRITLPFSERRVVLLAGDALLVNGAVLTALYLWACVDGRAFDSSFVRARWYWFPILTILWWFLGRFCDLYDVSVAGKSL